MVARANRALAGAFVAAFVVVGSWGSSALAQQMSDRTVQSIMNLAFSYIPAKFTYNTGKVFVVDRKDKKRYFVPLDSARKIITVGRLSAHAQACSLFQTEQSNFKAMMQSERKKGKWTEDQLFFIHMLHTFTIILANGDVKVSVDGETKNVEELDKSKPKKNTCTDSEIEQINNRVRAYIKQVTGKS